MAVKEDYLPPKGIDALCENAAGVTYEKLSEDNIRIVKDKLLDITGCILGGSIVREDAFLTDYFRNMGGKEEAAVFTKGFRIPLVNAVQLNSLYARANDFGAMFFRVRDEHIASHNSESIIPMGLTYATTRKVSGKEFIANDVAAEDLTSRILYSLPVRWPTDMLLVSSCTTALACRYNGFNGSQFKTALSYAQANSTNPGNSYYDYSQEFKYHNAESSRMGIMAVELTKGGWRGYRDPYFGHWGLVTNQIKDGSDLPALYEGVFTDLGKEFYIEESFKRYPGGIPTTAAANAGKDVRDQIISCYGKLDPSKIRKVHVSRSSKVRYNYYSEPFVLRNHINALFCFQFSACCALLYGDVGVKNVQTDAINADRELVRLAEESTFDVFNADTPLLKVVVEMEDGREFFSIKDYAGSMHEYPSHEFLVSKFTSQAEASGIMTGAKIKKIIELAGRIETLEDMREYVELLNP